MADTPALQPHGEAIVERKTQEPYKPWTAAQKAEMAIALYGHPPGWTSQPGDEWVHAGGPYVVNVSAIKRFYGL